MLYTEIITVCCENYTKDINTQCWETAEVFSVEAGGVYNYHCDLTLLRRKKKKKKMRQGLQRKGLLHYYKGDRKFTLLNILSLFPLVLMVKVCWRQGKALRSEEGRTSGSGLLRVGSRGKD
jgi:hypothetical protein